MNRPWKIVVTDAPYPDTQPIFDAFAKAGNCEVTLLPEGTSRAETFQVCKDADAVLFAYFEVNEEFLSTLQRCRVISRFGIGMNTIDIPACTRHGIYVANVRTPQIRDVANHALTFILACAKKLTISNEMVRHGIWSQDPVVPIYQLTNKVVGLVGFGQIARQVAKRVVACDMQVISYDPFVDEETMKQAGVRKVSMEELLETADFVSLHLPYTKETEKTINTAAFDRMKETAYCANTSLICVVAKTPDERLAMASSRATWNNAAKFAWPLLCTPLLSLLTVAVGERYSYALLAFILAWSMFFGFLIHFKLTEGYEESGAAELADTAKTARAKTGLLDLFKSLFANPPLLVLIVADLAKWLFNFIVASTVFYYFTYIALDQGLQTTYTLVIAFMAVFGALGSRFIGKKLSSRMTVIISYFLMGICLLIGRVFFESPWFVIVMLSIAQLFYGCVYSCSTALYADTAVYYEWKTGKNATGWIMGLSILSLNIASMLKGTIVVAALALGGFSAAVAASEASPAMKAGIANALLVIPAIMLFVGAFVLIFLYRLTKDRVEAMQLEIDRRNAVET
jgi:phosphoglycerate dehydrogenase-like enzyme/Na+/melibiose symporter-like transporter